MNASGMLPNQERRPCNHEETVSPAGGLVSSGWRGYPLLGALLLLVAGLLTGCPSKALGSLGVGIYATNTERCDDGIKVEVEFNASGLSDGLASYVPEEENVYGGGANWVWVKPGKTAGWAGSTIPTTADSTLPGGPVTVSAWCMRTSGQSPGKA